MNVIASGTGTGKTEFIRRALLKRFPDVDPTNILYVTSRSMIRDQQALMEGIEKMEDEDSEIVRYWNAELADLQEMRAAGIWIMNLNQLIHIIDAMNPLDGDRLSRIQIVVFDECHALYSDTFMEGLIAVRCWIKGRISTSDTLFIGLTATPGILKFYERKYGIRTYFANDEMIVNYKAKHLICTDYDRIIDLLNSGRLSGKTMIMCPSVTSCFELRDKIPNSEVLCSMRHKRFTNDMLRLRTYILEHQRFPPLRSTIYEQVEDDGPIDVLLTTSTMREGVNLCEESGIKNVICCFGDELHIKQFAGRCRFNIENLIIAAMRYRFDNRLAGEYVQNQRLLYWDYVKDKTDSRWFESIQGIVDVGFDEIERFRIERTEAAFCKLLEEKWPVGSDHLIFKEEDKEWLKELAYECDLLHTYRSKYSYIAVVKYMEHKLGYTFEEVRVRAGDRRLTGRRIAGRKEMVQND